MDHAGETFTHPETSIITAILIARGSERFYLLIVGSEDLKVCSKLVLAQELWSYGARTGEGCGKVGASNEGGKNQGLYHREAVLSVWLSWRSRAAALCPYPGEAKEVAVLG